METKNAGMIEVNNDDCVTIADLLIKAAHVLDNLSDDKRVDVNILDVTVNTQGRTVSVYFDTQWRRAT